MNMLTEDGKHLYVSYDEYHNLCEKLAIRIHQSGWEFDTILCLARGGMRPGDILSRIFDKPLAITYGTAELPPLVGDSRALHAKRSAEHLPGPLIPIAGADHFTITHQLRDPEGELTRQLMLLA